MYIDISFMRAQKPKHTEKKLIYSVPQILHASLDRLMYNIHNYHQGETGRGLNKKNIKQGNKT